MAKKRRTEPRGIAGRPGAAGTAGNTAAARHARRLTVRGGQGVTGVPGSSGAPGQPLPSTHVQLLEVVETQIEDIYQVLDVQVRRFAQIQQQVDELRGKVRQLMEKARISN